jgi:hypothetical protein
LALTTTWYGSRSHRRWSGACGPVAVILPGRCLFLAAASEHRPPVAALTLGGSEAARPQWRAVKGANCGTDMEPIWNPRGTRRELVSASYFSEAARDFKSQYVVCWRAPFWMSDGKKGRSRLTYDRRSELRTTRGSTGAGEIWPLREVPHPSLRARHGEAFARRRMVGHSEGAVAPSDFRLSTAAKQLIALTAPMIRTKRKRPRLGKQTVTTMS